MAGKIVEGVITGAPSGGKTSAMSHLAQIIPQWGPRVLVVPEVATLWITAGIGFPGVLAERSKKDFLALQRSWQETHFALRRQALAQVALFPESEWVILYDRGSMDAEAFMGPELFRAMLEEDGLQAAAIRDCYDFVLHMESAACGSAGYTLENNTARSETAEQARDIDAKIKQAWCGHPHFKVIAAQERFEDKMQAVTKAMARFLGVPVPVEIERKYLLASPPDMTSVAMQRAVCIDIEQAYLASERGEEVRIRRRSQHGAASYYLTRKVGSGLQRHEVERRITPTEYLEMMAMCDPHRTVIHKHRWCFVYDNQYFELDHILEPAAQAQWLLEVELTEEADEVRLPPFLEVTREVTGDQRFSNAILALRQS